MAECVDDDAQVFWLVRRLPLGPYKLGREHCDVAPLRLARRGFGRRPRPLGCARCNGRRLALCGGVRPGLCDQRQRKAQPVEAVALAGHGDNQSRLFRIGLDLSPQLSDQHVDAAVERLEAAAGEGVQESVAADHPSRAGDERPQDCELAARQLDRIAGLAGEHASVEVEDKAGKAQRRCGFSRLLDPVKSRNFAHRR